MILNTDLEQLLFFLIAWELLGFGIGMGYKFMGILFELYLRRKTKF